MFKKLNFVLNSSLAFLLFFAVVLPEVAVANSEKDLDVVDFEVNEASEEIDGVIDEYFEENGLYSIEFEKMTEKEADEFFDQLLSTDEYLSFENEVSTMSQGQSDKILGRAVPIALIPIGIVALRLLVTQGSKAAVAYLKKATKKLANTYKITFPGGNQLILIQDKKTSKRVFSIDKHNVKMVHKTTNKGYPGSVSVWHFHAPPDTGQHLMLCSSVPKNYKVQKGKCYF